ncbi:alpha-aminoadipate/glutamate carrier protein LysW [Streptomyces sp. NPDC091406]|uniref:alpha-aminoadipate/glutamate carrier protein LysW n=1 Tax=unclassified Streptomyces TaxID=2593676 RepID=UPI00381B83A8
MDTKSICSWIGIGAATSVLNAAPEQTPTRVRNSIHSIPLGGALSAVACPECEAQVELAQDARPTEIIECTDCRVELEVVSVTPASVTTAPEVEEDWGE